MPRRAARHFDVVWSSIRQPPMRDAACKERPGLPWVPDYNDARENMLRAADLREMRAICGSCVHKIECREFAVENSMVVGVWGGLTTQERREIRLLRRGWRE